MDLKPLGYEKKGGIYAKLVVGRYHHSSGFVGTRTGWPRIGRSHQYIIGSCAGSGSHLAGAANKD